MGLDSSICRSIACSESWPLTAARYRRISLVLSVFPAPDSPLRKRNLENENARIITYYRKDCNVMGPCDELWPDYAALVPQVTFHVKVAGFSNSEDVWRQFAQLSTLIQLNLWRSIDVKLCIIHPLMNFISLKTSPAELYTMGNSGTGLPPPTPNQRMSTIRRLFTWELQSNITF